MLSIQKSPTNKTGLGYVAPASNIPSASKTVFVKPTVSEPSPTVEEKGKDKINGDVLGTKKPPTIRKSPICHHCRLSGHVRPQCSLLKAQREKVMKEVFRQANYGTRPLAQYQTPWHQAPYHAPWNQTPRHHAPRRQAPQHQWPQQRFVPANHSGKSKINKSKHFKKSQKVEDDQYCREPPIWMQSMMKWMGRQMKSCQQLPIGRQAWVRKKGRHSPYEGE
jgi:hypothetical protein